MFGWTGNMERLALSNAHQKADDPQREFYLKQRKSLEINPRHPLIKDLLRRVRDDVDDQKAKDIAVMLFRTGNWNFEVLTIHELIVFSLNNVLGQLDIILYLFN